MHWSSPRARAGFSMLAASIEPWAFPAPTMVCISSIKRITSLFFESSVRIALMRSSNSPRYLVPATIEAMSSATTRLLNRTRGTWRWIMRRARPSTMADFPTPGSPMRTGLFFLRRLRIWARRSISVSRPTTGSRRPSWAARVMSWPNLSSMGVSPAPERFLPEVEDWREACDWSPRSFSGASSSSAPMKPAPAFGAIPRFS